MVEKKIIKPRKAIEQKEQYNPPLENRRGLMRLDFNENTVGCSPKVLEAINNIREEEIASYPEYAKFKSKLAYHLKIGAEQVMITNASDEAIMIIMQTYIEKGEEIVLPIPTFAMFRFYAQIVEAKIKDILYANNLTFPTKKVLDAITTKTKLIVLCNPNNPTGTLIEKKDIIKIIEKAGKNGALVLLDEAYYQYSEIEYLKLINVYTNLIIIRTFSKAYGMAGLRLGYIASNSEVIKNLSKSASPYSVNSVAIVAASVAIEDDAYIKWYTHEVKRAKTIMYEGLKNLNVKTYPTAANFLIAKFPNKSKEIEQKLREKGILVRDRNYEPLLKDCLRIGIGTERQAKDFIKALKEVLR